MQIGQVRMSPIPAVIKATIELITNMMMPPGIVEYNIPRGPNRTVRMIATPMLLVDVVTTVCGCKSPISSPFPMLRLLVDSVHSSGFADWLIPEPLLSD